MQGKIEEDARKTATMILQALGWQPEFKNIEWLNSKDLHLETIPAVQSKPGF